MTTSLAPTPGRPIRMQQQDAIARRIQHQTGVQQVDVMHLGGNTWSFSVYRYEDIAPLLALFDQNPRYAFLEMVGTVSAAGNDYEVGLFYHVASR